MKQGKYLFAIILLAILSSGQANAQKWLKNLKDKAVNTVTDKVEQKVQNTVSKKVDDMIDGDSNNNNDDGCQNDDLDQSANGKQKKVAQGEDLKNDFVPGNVVIFEDNLLGEKLGEFPSKWDLLENNAEVARMNGKMAIKFENGSETRITPLIKDGNRTYLPDVYTLEFDFFMTGEESHESNYWLHLNEDKNNYRTSYIRWWNDKITWNVYKPKVGDDNEDIEGSKDIRELLNYNDWNHFALSFNKRALKVYINDYRVINIPNARAMNWMEFKTEFWKDHIDYITNVRLAKGGVELYERNASDMSPIEKAISETGKFVTNNILFPDFVIVSPRNSHRIEMRFSDGASLALPC